MVKDEEKRWHELLQLRTDAILDYQSTSDYDSITQYLASVREMLESQRQYTLNWFKFFEKTNTTNVDKMHIHARRRVVAMYHQEIELLEQCLEAPDFIYTKGEAIVQGIW